MTVAHVTMQATTHSYSLQHSTHTCVNTYPWLVSHCETHTHETPQIRQQYILATPKRPKQTQLSAGNPWAGPLGARAHDRLCCLLSTTSRLAQASAEVWLCLHVSCREWPICSVRHITLTQTWYCCRGGTAPMPPTAPPRCRAGHPMHSSWKAAYASVWLCSVICFSKLRSAGVHALRPVRQLVGAIEVPNSCAVLQKPAHAAAIRDGACAAAVRSGTLAAAVRSSTVVLSFQTAVVEAGTETGDQLNIAPDSQERRGNV